MGIFDRKPNIGKMKAKGDVEGLIKALRYKKDWVVGAEATDALIEIVDDRTVGAIEPLIQTLKDECESVREHAVMVLEEIAQAAVEPLIQAMKDKNMYVRDGAARALGDVGDERAVAPLIQALRDENKDVHCSASVALEKIGDKGAVEPLILINELLRNKDKYTRMETARALPGIKDKRVAKALIEVIEKEPGEWATKAAFKSLKVICAPVVGTLIKQTPVFIGETFVYYSYYVHKDTAKLLERIDDIDALIKMLEDSDADVRNFASEALRELRKRAVKSLNDEDEGVREAAKKALEKIQKK